MYVFAVHNLEESRLTYEGVLGLRPAVEYVSEEESIRVIRYYVGSVAVELLEPLNHDCEVARFLKKRGEGFFLIFYRVDDVQESLEELRGIGKQTIDDKPRRLMGNRYAFLEPPDRMHGVLTEIVDGSFTS
ncbi:MAG: VOC family protein [Deltaproteobacteria bacterium]|nr:VOC family protein [Deltaproteobacteria bacterium]